jgi:hypothetical protein
MMPGRKTRNANLILVLELSTKISCRYQKGRNIHQKELNNRDSEMKKPEFWNRDSIKSIRTVSKIQTTKKPIKMNGFLIGNPTCPYV